MTAEQRKLDQVAGYWTAFVLNLILILLTIYFLLDPMPLMTLLPWLINGAILAVSLLFRPQFAVGYLIAIAVLVVAAILYIPSCLATCYVVEEIGFSSADYENFPLPFTIMYIAFWLIVGIIWSWVNWFYTPTSRKEKSL